MSSQSSSMIAKAATAALVSALTLAACALPPPPPPRSPDAAAPTADVLAGTSWALATLGGQPPIQGTAITLNFGDDNRVSGNDGCNMFGGTYTVDGDVLKFGPLMGTLMACPEPVMKQADAFRQTLEHRPGRHELGGDQLQQRQAGRGQRARRHRVDRVIWRRWPGERQRWVQQLRRTVLTGGATDQDRPAG